MARSRKLPPRSRPVLRSAQSPRRPPAVKMLISSKQHRHNGWKARLTGVALLLVTIALVMQGSWVAVQLIVNPGSVSWLGWLLPEWNLIPLSRYQTLHEIQTEAIQQGLTALDLQMALSKDERLVAIFAPQHHCSETSDATAATCRQLIELRVYRRLPANQDRSRAPALEVVDRLAIVSPRETAVLAPLLSQPGTSPGNSRSLPLDTVSAMQGATSGIWLDLSGNWFRGGDRIAYGQLVRYDSKQHRLYGSIQWTSPTGVSPVWQQITGSAAPELVVNETVGLEPDFRIYQVRSVSHRASGNAAATQGSNPIQLEAIALTSAALQNQTYENGLTLARHGLWTSALQLMQETQRWSSDWPATAQAQLDLVAFHAAITKEQADRTWANPNQALAANLLDGRWTKALQLLHSALKDGYEINDLLTADVDRLWDRVRAALSIRPQQPDVQAWGTLILFARQGRAAAIAWLQQQNPMVAAIDSPNAAPLDARLQQVLDLLNQTLLSTEHSSRIIGTVTPIANPNPADWLQPSTAPLRLADQQTWYRIQVDSFYDGARWRRSPFTDLNPPAIGRAQQLWNLLGLSNDPQIQIIVWRDGQPQTLEATVKATQLRGGRLQLLASGSAEISLGRAASQPPPLAITTATVHWVEPPQTLTLEQLNQQQPLLATALMPTLWQTTQTTHSGATHSEATNPTASVEEMLQAIGSWTVQQIDLTGDDQPEAIVSLTVNSSPDSHRPQTLIFSHQGTLIYSQLGRESGESLTAIADSGDGKTALLVDNGQSYRLRHWSSQQQRFE
jgi:hypothetical protein